MNNLRAPLLIFGYGNPSRGDDALGPLLLERLEAINLPHVEVLTDFQLQVEHALDLQDRDKVLFIDASVSCTAPYAFSRLQPQKDTSYSSHVMSPAAVLHAYQDMYGTPPSAYLLEVRGERFELGEPLSLEARSNLDAAFSFLKELCARSDLREWRQLSTRPTTPSTRRKTEP
ncbi:hydrogenase maturation protease [Nitrosospira sp. Nsp14]|uniref:hydrogenase maturation protease n=1 Tax=Nitrosospira sp. Nsp14 TaxID=1855333 RepID=UPI0008DEC27D|nr:hydrogenase maturation protease [Nitrosospira sp. Nsp14]SFH57159.1 hydrogenase maturation protease [Nitrosospira sp. Nsp14]